MDKRKLTLRSGRLLIYFFVAAIVVIATFFGIYKLFLGQAFADRGFSENVMPTIVSSKKTDLHRFNELFNCKSHSKVVDIPAFSVGMFPYLLKNTENTCNRAPDFIGVERFLDAFLYGEAGIAKAANAKSKETPFLTHHPGLFRLKKMVTENIPLDRSNSFFWWMFPLPIATPSRGFTYSIFWGDFVELMAAAERRNLDFVKLFGEGIQALLTLNGWIPEDSARQGKQSEKESVHNFSEQDHVFVKAYMSLQCVKLYSKDGRLSTHEDSLKSFMKQHTIRYPADYNCMQ